MIATPTGPNRRDFLKASTAGGFALGGFFGLGLNMAQTAGENIRNLSDTPHNCPATISSLERFPQFRSQAGTNSLDQLQRK